MTKSDNDWYNKWQQIITSGTTSGITSDNERVQWVTKRGNKSQPMTTSRYFD